MANLNQISVSSHDRTLRPYVIGFFVLLASVLCVSRAYLHAAPVTLLFEATVEGAVSGADGTVPPSLSFFIGTGDTVSGWFSFEPIDVGPSVQTTGLEVPFPFVVQIKSQRLTASHYGISVHDDIPAIEESPLLIDTISVGRQFFADDVTPGNTGSPIQWAFLMGFTGESTVLLGADIPQDPSIWEQFMLQRSLDIFFYPDSSGVYGFAARIDSLRTVPEGTTASLVMSAFVPFVLGCRLVRNRKYFAKGGT